MLRYLYVILHSWNCQLKKTNFCKCRNKNGKLFTSAVTLFEEKRRHSFMIFLVCMGFCYSIAAIKEGSFIQPDKLQSTHTERQESCFSFPFSFALLVIFSSRYWKLTGQKERWSWTHKKWDFDLKEVNQRVGSTHITRSGEVMSHIMSNNDTSEKKITSKNAS